MRRALLAATAGLFLLAGSACDSDANGKPEAASTAPTAAATVLAAPDYSASTEQVCSKLQTLYTAELRNFGTAMGKMVSYKENKQAADAEKAESTAAAQLKAAAAKIRKETALAEDPDFIAAGKVSASKLESSATDRRYFDTVKTLADLNKTVQNQFTEWLNPVAGYCRTADSSPSSPSSPTPSVSSPSSPTPSASS
ncbi:hypothetical protein [Paractinoplanes ferrugineus]|uniref:Lipoprotein n=1 Tax=Paractinoplanes ferrugineus TaxID=113564 RepID=A0A919J0I4_9ACTN|nr:hypothetical protein [Actinoplanes ferrugineus]GIE08316.1 hypothetical protein Afe05nite_01560 [Actinoplanes ferrugineus]